MNKNQVKNIYTKLTALISHSRRFADLSNGKSAMRISILGFESGRIMIRITADESRYKIRIRLNLDSGGFESLNSGFGFEHT